jgi:tetratricopeptide (TPR) repeat protein
MDAKHRHELKTNELADWLAHAPEFMKRNASTIIGVVLIIIGLATWPLFSQMRQQRQITNAASITEMIQKLETDIYRVLQAAEQEDGSAETATNALLVNANALMDQAEHTDNPDLRALALIKAAQALRAELHVRPELIGTEQINERIEQARQAYEKALASAASPTLKAMAKLGLGLCAEELGQRDQAAEIYQQIMNSEEFAATAFPAKAQKRLAALNQNLETVVFAPAPVEQPALPEGTLPDPASVFQTPPSLDAITPATPQFLGDAPNAPDSSEQDSTEQPQATPDDEQN